MARIQHLAIASLDPEKQAEFYKKVFGFQEVQRLDNPRARGVVLTDGHIKMIDRESTTPAPEPCARRCLFSPRP